VATLRFDKRAAHVYAAAWPKDAGEVNAFFSYQNFIGDATAAYRFLRAREGVSRVAILGHSEGGLFALQVARDLAGSEERPAGLILAATAGRVLDVVLREQLAALLEKQTRDPAVREMYLGHVDRGIAAAKAGEAVPADMPAGLVAIFNPTVQDLLRAYFTVDPCALAAEVRGPVLVLQGELDAQVSAERDAPRLHEALAKRGEAELVVVPGASHNFKSVGSAAEPGFSGPVVTGALEAVAGWCGKIAP
jgi:pimeloyl-ACP methyl ester carboxylesterase